MKKLVLTIATIATLPPWRVRRLKRAACASVPVLPLPRRLPQRLRPTPIIIAALATTMALPSRIYGGPGFTVTVAGTPTDDCRDGPERKLRAISRLLTRIDPRAVGALKSAVQFLRCLSLGSARRP